jgi:hypothetical protein
MNETSPPIQDALSARIEQTHLKTTKLQNIDSYHYANVIPLTGGIFVLALVTFSLATYLIRKGVPSGSILKVFGTILIIFAAVFLMVAGYSDTQVAPVIGLLGTIAGYLLGKSTTADMQIESKSPSKEEVLPPKESDNDLNALPSNISEKKPSNANNIKAI